MDRHVQSAPFLSYLEEWRSRLQPLELARAVANPAAAAIVSIDVINGFCYEGPLASARVATIVSPIARLFARAHEIGIRDFVLIQEAHSEHATEFQAWGPHCIRGTSQAQTVKELAELPFANEFAVITKNTIHPALGTSFEQWLGDHQAVSTFVVVGDCTDICTYQLAIYLKLLANAKDVDRRVIVPEDCSQTYDMPVDRARELGIMPHDGDLFHAVFLYHMAMNGIQVVKGIR